MSSVMICPVALVADAATWLFRAGILLTVRLTGAVALAATAFSAAVLIAEHLDTARGHLARDNTVLSEVVVRPLLPKVSDVPIRVAAAH